MADELGQSQIDLERGLQPGRLGGEVFRDDDRLEFNGGQAAVLQLRQAFDNGEASSLPELIALDWQEFVGSDRRSLHYAHSSFFVRYLLTGGDPELAEGFRLFLQDVAAGGELTAEALVRRLGSPYPELEVRFRAWVELLAAGVEEVAAR
jgi:hypothetical protein